MEMLLKRGAEEDRPFGIAGFGRNQFDKAILILHLPVDDNCAVLQIDIFPFQAKGFIDTQTAIASQQVSGLCVCAFEIIIQKNKFLTAERHNIGIILCLHLWHFDAGVFIYTEFVVGIYFQIIAGIGLPEDQVKHFQKGFGVLIRKTFHIVKIGEIIIDLRRRDFIHEPLAVFRTKVIIPKAVLLLFGSVGSVSPAVSTVFLIHFFEGLSDFWSGLLALPLPLDCFVSCPDSLCLRFQRIAKFVLCFADILLSPSAVMV